MTSTDSTSSPSSHTARTNRSTSTVVFPVPAPADTKTSPLASAAARCCGFTSGPLHAAHRPHVAPGGAAAALRVVAHVPGPDALGARARTFARGLHQPPELVVREVVVPLVAGQVAGGVLVQQPPRDPGARESAVHAAEGLDPDEVAEHEHVERDLQLQLFVDLLRRVGAAARLVVLHDPPRRERVDVDAVDLPAQVDSLAEVEAALQLRRRALR